MFIFNPTLEDHPIWLFVKVETTNKLYLPLESWVGVDPNHSGQCANGAVGDVVSWLEWKGETFTRIIFRENQNHQTKITVKR